MNLKIKIPKKILIGIFLLMLISLALILFLPLLFSKRFAEKQISNADKTKTYQKSRGLFNQEIVVFSQQENGDATANFLKISRSYFIFWKLEEKTFKTLTTSQYLPESEKKNESQKNLDLLAKTVKEGKITSGDNKTYQKERLQDDLVDVALSEKYQENAIIYEATSPDEKNNLALVYGPQGKGTRLKVNGKIIDKIINPVSVSFSTDSKYIYYTDYVTVTTTSPVHPEVYSGKVYRYNLAQANIEEVFSFGVAKELQVKATSKYLIYTLSNGEIGLIDLNTKSQKLLMTLSMPSEGTPPLIMNIDEDYVLIQPNDVEYFSNGNKRLFKIDFKNQSLTELSF